MGKTLVLAEKPSVGRDLQRALPGAFTKHEGYLESDQHVVTWAVGHLVQLAEPDEYDPKYKKWRMADLPIVPPDFKLVVRDERSRKQMGVITKLLKRADVDDVINACDAGREGELIFAWTFQKANAKKPVQRLWLSSMTSKAIAQAFGALRPASELARLEQAARSRSEADWIVGMNATRAATIRLRSSFDGAVSLGRVQTPTLAIVARREEEIRAFKPEPYWLVDASFEPTGGEGGRRYEGRFHAGANPRLASAAEAEAIVAAVRGRNGAITKLEKSTKKERAPLLYDLTSLQRDANTRYGFSARRTLAAAQRLYEEHKALTYPRTNSRFLPGDMVPELKPIAGQVGRRSEYARAAAYVTGLDLLPLGRVVNDAKVTDHHAIIPTNATHNVDKMSDDDRRVYDMVARRFLAAFHPEAVFENTRLETTVAEHVFRTRGRVLVVPGWRGVYGEGLEERSGDDDEGTDQQLPKLERGEDVATLKVESAEKETKPPRRYSDASLLGAMETAGKLVDDDELREAMKDSGIGTPATRAAIIERLIDVAYIEREGRALVCTEKGLNVIRLLGEHALTSPSLTGDWEHRLGQDRGGRGVARALHARHRVVRRRDRPRARREAQGGPDPARQPRAVPRVRAGHRREPQGLLVLVARGSRMRVRDLEVEGRQDDPDGRRARADLARAHREARDRVPRPLRPVVPRPSGADADRGRQVARRVRRAVGARGREAARGRGDGRRRRRGRSGAGRLAQPRRPPRVVRPMRRLLSPILFAALLVPAAAEAAPRVTAAPGRLAVTYDAQHRTGESFGALAVAPDGTVLAGGGAGLSRRLAVTAIAPDGRLDRRFGAGGGARSPFAVRETDALVRAGDGTLYAVGRLPTNDGSTLGRPAVVRLTAAGTFDRAYGLRPLPGLVGVGCLGCRSAALTPDGGLVVAGRSGTERSARFAVVKLRADGTPDPAFGIGGVAHPLPGEGGARELAVRPDGRIVVNGRTGPLEDPDESRELVIGLRADGRRDPAFAIVEPLADVSALRLDARGRVLVATSATGSSASIERYTAAGLPDTGWGGDGRVALGRVGFPALASVDGGVVVAAKSFGAPLRRVALDDAGRVGARSATRLTFGGGTFQLGSVLPELGTPDWGPQAIAARPDGSLALAGGVFLTLASDGGSIDGSEAALAFVRPRGGFVRTRRSPRPVLGATVPRQSLRQGGRAARPGAAVRPAPARPGARRRARRRAGRGARRRAVLDAAADARAGAAHGRGAAAVARGGAGAGAGGDHPHRHGGEPARGFGLGHAASLAGRRTSAG